ncbi:MAG: hypothetical protein LIO85_01260 [Rikenellaceae bacterium]|nr:hypothetical protein [Rikenellaceae bacterium]
MDRAFSNGGEPEPDGWSVTPQQRRVDVDRPFGNPTETGRSVEDVTTAVLPDDIEITVKVCGVGMAETAAAVAGILASAGQNRSGRPDLVLLAGIAGAYPGSGLKAGDCVAVASEKIADLGAVRGGGFEPLFEKQYASPLAVRQNVLPSVPSLTVNCIGGPHDGCYPPGEYAVENMEGAAFFAACLAAGLPFIEVRAVSNCTTDPRGEWRIGEALTALREGTLQVAAELLKSN